VPRLAQINVAAVAPIIAASDFARTDESTMDGISDPDFSDVEFDLSNATDDIPFESSPNVSAPTISSDEAPF
jgi:hypothetical protein